MIVRPLFTRSYIARLIVQQLLFSRSQGSTDIECGSEVQCELRFELTFPGETSSKNVMRKIELFSQEKISLDDKQRSETFNVSLLCLSSTRSETGNMEKCLI